MELDKIINEIISNNPELVECYQNNKKEIKTLIVKLHVKKEDIKDIIKLYKIIGETDIIDI